METMKFELIKDKYWGYTLVMNGEVLMECLSEEEMRELSFGEILKLIKECRMEVK